MSLLLALVADAVDEVEETISVEYVRRRFRLKPESESEKQQTITKETDEALLLLIL
jgi:hypothetical protein